MAIGTSVVRGGMPLPPRPFLGGKLGQTTMFVRPPHWIIPNWSMTRREHGLLVTFARQ